MAALALAGMAVPLAGINSPALGVLFGLPLALALPGYALLAAGAPDGSLGPAERLGLSVGASIAVCVLGGLLLDATPWGLRGESWALLLGGVTLAACAIAAARRQRNATIQLAAPVRVRPLDAALFGLAAVIAGAALLVAMRGASATSDTGFTQLWMLPADNRVRIGIQSMETAPVSYDLELLAGERVARRWSSIELRPGELWEARESLPAGRPVEARLYRHDAPGAVYRRVTLR